jgi:hypothetical protein
MLEFFNLSAGDYYLEINIDIVNMYPFGQERWFWVENDLEMNRDPYCNLENGITIGSNLDADVGDNFAFSANCFDMDGDSMTLSVVIDHASFASPFFFADVTPLSIPGGNTSIWNYTFSEPGLYAFGLSVEDSNGAKQAYAFAVTAHVNDMDPNANNTDDCQDTLHPGGVCWKIYGFAFDHPDGTSYCEWEGDDFEGDMRWYCATEYYNETNPNYSNFTDSWYYCESDFPPEPLQDAGFWYSYYCTDDFGQSPDYEFTTNNATYFADGGSPENSNATTEEEILEAIEAGGLPSVSMFASVVAIALIALRRRN